MPPGCSPAPGSTRFFRDPRTNRTINVTFAILLIASVAVALMV